MVQKWLQVLYSAGGEVRDGLLLIILFWRHWLTTSACWKFQWTGSFQIEDISFVFSMTLQSCVYLWLCYFIQDWFPFGFCQSLSTFGNSLFLDSLNPLCWFQTTLSTPESRFFSSETLFQFWFDLTSESKIHY